MSLLSIRPLDAHPCLCVLCPSLSQMASEAAGYGVRVNMICPIFVQTALLSSLESEEAAGEFYPLRDINTKLLQTYGTLE